MHHFTKGLAPAPPRRPKIYKYIDLKKREKYLKLKAVFSAQMMLATSLQHEQTLPHLVEEKLKALLRQNINKHQPAKNSYTSSSCASFHRVAVSPEAPGVKYHCLEDFAESSTKQNPARSYLHCVLH